MDQKPKSESVVEYVPLGETQHVKLSLEIVKSFVAVPTKSGAVPTPRDCMKFIMLCRAQQLNPFAGDAFLVGYDGKDGPQFSLITAHQALLKRAESSDQYEGMESGLILKDGDKIIESEGDFFTEEQTPLGAWARVHRKGRHPTYKRLRLEQRKPAYPSRFWDAAHQWEQLVKTAESDALRATFPTLIGGMFTGAEVLERGTGPAVEVPQVATDAPPATPALVPTEAPGPSAAVPIEKSPQAELAEIVTGAGYTYDEFVRWAVDSGNDEHVADKGSFDELPSVVAKRLIRAKVGLLAGIGQIVGRAAMKGESK